jgi:adenylyltransferase/sulfurtransferase
MTTLKIPTPLRPYAGGQEEIDVPSGTIGDALTSLTEQHPDLKQHIFNEEGQLRPFVNLYLNQDDVRYLDGLATPVAEKDLLRIIPSIAGGQS